MALVVPILALGGCLGADPPGPSGPAASPDGGGVADPPDAAPVTARCSGLASPAADRELTLTRDGLERTYWVHLPPSYDPTRPTPLVLNFHGYTFNATQHQRLTRYDDESDAEGFIAVYPEGTGSSQSWNAGACCGEAAEQQVDDVGFVTAMLDALESELCIDPARVYATGMSNGGFLSHRLACELSDRIAAIAPVAGVIGVVECVPERPVPVLQFHGTLDTLVPYGGDESEGFPSVGDTMQAWADRNGCTGEPQETFSEGYTRCETWADCEAGAEVVLCTTTGGGHTWPGGIPMPVLGHTTTDISATDAAWDFFARHPRPSL